MFVRMQGHTIVCVEDIYVVTWNYSQTYNVWRVADNTAELIECFTTDEATTVDEAEVISNYWLTDNGYAE